MNLPDSQGRMEAIPDIRVDDVYAGLAKLRESFPPDRIEKLPKPLYKNAWADQPKSQCIICGGYHPRANTIHLDYVGHANCTDRLLEVDPCWDWEPLAYTEAGTPLFTDGGLWIKLTVCGMTRIGFGDGNSVKEVIGDAIRNAAMRFGVALDLWAKINLHEERNPGDGPTPQRKSGERTDSGGAGRRRQAPKTAGRDAGQADPGVAADPAPNEDALAELGSVCDQHGYDRRSCGGMYAEWTAQQEHPGTPRLLDADPESIRRFAVFLVGMAEADPASGGGVPDEANTGADVAGAGTDSGGAEGGVDAAAGAGDGDEDQEGAGTDAAGGEDPVAEADPLDTSDVEKKPGDIF